MRAFLFSFAVGASAALSGELVDTPLGPRPTECVHTLEEGAKIVRGDGGVTVVSPNGGSAFYPEIQECVEDAANLVAARTKRKLVDEPNAWLDNVGYYPPDGELVAYFSANYTIPPDPVGSGQVLYYFIGTQNNDGSGSGITILQPVLAYIQDEWTYASWNCCPSGQSHTGRTLTGMQAGDSLFGVIEKAGDKYNVVSGWSEDSATLTVADAQRNFDWADVTLEQYTVTTCDQLPVGPMTYTNLFLRDQNQDVITPQWSDPKTTMCNGRMNVSGTTISITHN